MFRDMLDRSGMDTWNVTSIHQSTQSHLAYYAVVPEFAV